MHACILSHISCVQLFATLLTVIQQAPLFIGFARQGNWSRLLYPLARHAPHLGIKLESSYISCIGRNVLYHYRHLGSTKYWYKSAIFGSNNKKKKKKDNKIGEGNRREKVELRKVRCKIIFIETMYRKSMKRMTFKFCDPPHKKKNTRLLNMLMFW